VNIGSIGAINVIAAAAKKMSVQKAVRRRLIS
jgi:hypothetical protein